MIFNKKKIGKEGQPRHRIKEEQKEILGSPKTDISDWEYLDLCCGFS